MKNIHRTTQFTIPLLLISLLLPASGQLTAGTGNEYIIGETVTLYSDVLQEERSIIVYLPDSYDFSSMNYGTVYLLDGETHFHHASGVSSYLSQRGKIPELIVVAIKNVDRNRDFSPTHTTGVPTSGGAEKFLTFLENELMPFVDRNYRTLDFNILVGHSFGGTFATYSLLSKPDLFDGYISISPYLMYDNNYLVDLTEKRLKSKYNNVRYCMSLGNEPGYVEALDRFQNIIHSKQPKGLTFSYTQYSDENHGTVPHLSIYYGVQALFPDWELKKETFREGLPAIDKHYQSLATKYGYPTKTPETVINRLGYQYLQNGQLQMAIQLFKENIKRYPGSANVYDSLGEAYEKNGQEREAKENYSKAVELAKKSGHPNLNLYQANLDRTLVVDAQK